MPLFASAQLIATSRCAAPARCGAFADERRMLRDKLDHPRACASPVASFGAGGRCGTLAGTTIRAAGDRTDYRLLHTGMRITNTQIPTSLFAAHHAVALALPCRQRQRAAHSSLASLSFLDAVASCHKISRVAAICCEPRSRFSASSTGIPERVEYSRKYSLIRSIRSLAV